jgi:predicted lipoprotein with Yx(FWY)xxD motif
MPRPLKLRPSSHRIRAIAIVLAIASLAVGAAVSQAARPSKRVASKAENPTLGKAVLTTTKGQTLYSLSAEVKGRFICTGSCLSVWHPLRVPSGTRPTGPVKLGTIERPEGGIQVTYRGKPLYRFGGDAKTGDANGEGIKDVGTWHAAVVPTPPAEEPPQPQPQPENPYPYGY